MVRRALLALVLAATASAVVVPVAAAAATPAAPVGGVISARQDTFSKALTVTGWAFDPQHTAAALTLSIYVDGHYAGRATANRPSPDVDRSRHVTGPHRFSFHRTWTPRAGLVTIKRAGTGSQLARLTATRFTPSAGARIVTVAERFVGHARYVEGGATPAHGFDCSGYTMYVYLHAGVRRMPHNAEAQRRLHGMRRISRAAARPGDLVFYLAGGSAYHVAIYAGHGMQYAAATPRDGIRYQKVWSSQVEYRTTWH